MYRWKDKYDELYGESYENSQNHTVAHIYSNACDATCNIEGCEKTREAGDHKGGEATCTSLAICDVCGAEYGGFDYTNHSDTKTVYVRNTDDFRYHDLAYACCGTVIKTEKHTVTVAATCTTLMECELCGKVEGSLDPENHLYDEMYFAHDPKNEANHAYVHKCCDAIEGVEAHEGGVATCTALAVCDVCDLEYGKLDGNNHSSDAFEYTAIGSGSTRHNVNHACCGAFVGTDVHFGGEATCSGRAVCEGCGAEYGDISPENHASEQYKYSPASIGGTHYVYNACCGAPVGTEAHSGGEATCNSGAACEKCNAEYGEKNPENHASDKVTYEKSGAEGHKRKADCCGATVSTEAHSGGEATCKQSAVCTKCGEAYGELGDHSYTDSCDESCNVCELVRMPGHEDKNSDGVCDKCNDVLRVGDEQGTDGEDQSDTADETETETDGENQSNAPGETETETDEGGDTDTDGGTSSEDGSDKTEPGTNEGGNTDEGETDNGGKKGCTSTVGAGAMSFVAIVTLAGALLVGKKKNK